MLQLREGALLHLTAVNGVLRPSEATDCHSNATRSPKPYPPPPRGPLGPGRPAGPCSSVCVYAGAWERAGAGDGERFHPGAFEPANSGS